MKTSRVLVLILLAIIIFSMSTVFAAPAPYRSIKVNGWLTTDAGDMATVNLHLKTNFCINPPNPPIYDPQIILWDAKGRINVVDQGTGNSVNAEIATFEIHHAHLSYRNFRGVSDPDGIPDSGDELDVFGFIDPVNRPNYIWIKVSNSSTFYIIDGYMEHGVFSYVNTETVE